MNQRGEILGCIDKTYSGEEPHPGRERCDAGESGLGLHCDELDGVTRHRRSRRQSLVPRQLTPDHHKDPGQGVGIRDD
jgi:hypothetical protein